MKTHAFYTHSPDSIRAVAFLLKQGKAVALPTETVYGLAAHALDVTAVQKIFAIKGRPLIDPLIVHVLGISEAQHLAYLNEAAYKLATAFWPGPLTLILPKRNCVPDIVTAGQPSVAIRVPNHPIFREVLQLCQLPLAAPSANPFGYVSPTRAEHVRRTLGEKAPYILDGGPCEHGLESTILLLTNPQRPTILRPGPISRAAIEFTLGQPVAEGIEPCSDNVAQLAPGLLSQHYSPKTPLHLLPYHSPMPKTSDCAQVYWQRPLGDLPAQAYYLSETGDATVAAQNLYHLLQSLDGLQLKGIYWEEAPAGPLADAINNRLRRAATKR